MFSSRGPQPLNFWSMTPGTNSGSSTQRSQKSEWNQTASFAVQKPRKSNRSSERYSTVDCKKMRNPLAFHSNSSGKPANQKNFFKSEFLSQSKIQVKNLTAAHSLHSSNNNTLDHQGSCHIKTEETAENVNDHQSLDQKGIGQKRKETEELTTHLTNFNSHVIKKASQKPLASFSNSTNSLKPFKSAKSLYPQRNKRSQEAKALKGFSNLQSVKKEDSEIKSYDNNPFNSEVKEFRYEIDHATLSEQLANKHSSVQPKSQDPTPKASILSCDFSLSNKLPQFTKQAKDSRNQLQQPYMSLQVQNGTEQRTEDESSSNLSSEEQKGKDIKQSTKIQKTNISNNASATSKTPADIFSYKVKPPHQGPLKSNSNLNSKLRHSKPQSNTTSGSLQVFNSQTSGSSKANIKTRTLQKSDSQDSIFQPRSDLRNVNPDNFYSTQRLDPPNNTLQKGQVSSNSKEPSLVSKNSNNNGSKTTSLHPYILDFDSECRGLTQAIRVIARFRPFNAIEQELSLATQQQQEEMVMYFDDSKTVKVKEDFYSHSNNLTFTFDQVLKPNITQEQAYTIIGQDTISDVMSGYNGTIFAYGQTGSGKSYSMYGPDIFDEISMGIIPRAAKAIFDHIREQDLEVEYQIRVQMIEIYKESLRDLLYDSPDTPPELKIKEDPKRGTYVEGLTEAQIVCEEEIMTVLCTGETMRHVASTKLNQVSSRSHSICVIEVVQKYPNDSEKRGLLNLVDLAGSERVSKSLAQGQALEEAKKINFSLSMLGKVINCLTKNAPYIPYRDSKLTRLLKESLGGNNKTTLMVACSIHQSNIEETVSSLRFAQSAKFIQNKVKMNIKTSPEQLQMIIDQLKYELRFAKEEISRLKLTSSEQKAIECNHQSDFLFKTQEINPDQQLETPQPWTNRSTAKKNDTKLQILHNRPHESLAAKNYDCIETNNQRLQLLQQLSPELSVIPVQGTPSFTSPVKTYELKMSQLMLKNEDLEMRLKSKDLDIASLKQEKIDVQDKVSNLEDKVLNYKQKLLLIEKKLAEFESGQDVQNVAKVKENMTLENADNKIGVLTQQVNCLEHALEETEHNCQQLLDEKHQYYQRQFKDFLNDTLKLSKITVSEALNSFMSRDNAKKIQKKPFTQQLDIEKDYEDQQQLVSKSLQEVTLMDQDLLQQSLYSLELVNAVEEGSVAPEITIYLLKHLLIDASLANHNLQRITAVSRWRQVLDFGKSKMKAELCRLQEGTIETLEHIIEKSRMVHDKLRSRVDKLEYHLYDNRNYYGDFVQLTEGGNVQILQPSSQDYATKATNKSFQRMNTNPAGGIKEANNQNVSSSYSLGMTGNQTGTNKKCRFVRTITNKTLGKGFQFGDRSPISRASILGGNGNNSILSHYYGQALNTNATPNRTNGLCSPVVCGFQSPQRPQNAFGNPKGSQKSLPQFSLVNRKFTQKSTTQTLAVPNSKEAEPQSFEDALGNYNTANVQELVSPLPEQAKDDQKTQNFTLEDLASIESMNSLQDVKDYIKSKFEKAGSSEVHKACPMFSQYQNAAQTQHQSSQNQVLQQNLSENNNQNNENNSTNTNGFNCFSNDCYVDNQPASIINNLPCSTSGNLIDNQRQEHVMTMASEYLVTNNSVIGPSGLLNGPGPTNQYCQNDYLDRLQEKIVQLQEEVETQKCRAEEHKKAYYESKRQIEHLRYLTEKQESKQNDVLKLEIYQWENAVNKLKEMNELELVRKQREIQKLHEILAQWIDNYQELEKCQRAQPQKIEHLLVETQKHQRNQSPQLLREITNKFQDTATSATNYRNQEKQNSGFLRMLGNTLSQQSRQSGVNSTLGNQFATSDSATREKQVIKGDNSPCTQEESCIEFEQSFNQESQSVVQEDLSDASCQRE